MTDDDAFAGTLLSADNTLLGATVTNPAGETLGTLDDLILDSASGRIIYAVMSFGGLFGLGVQLFPVPWALLTLNASNDGFIVNLAKARLETAPRCDRQTEWTRRYASEVDSFYGVKRSKPA